MSFPGRPGVWGQFNPKEQYVQKEGGVKPYGMPQCALGHLHKSW